MEDRKFFKMAEEFRGFAENIKSALKEIENIRKSDKEPSLKRETLMRIDDRLFDYGEKVQEMMDSLIPEEIQEEAGDEITDLDEIYTRLSDCFFDAIECMREYVEMENDELVKEAGEAISEGFELLAEADGIIEELKESKK